MLEKFPIQMQSLNEERTIRVYLPQNYHNENKNYPVLYMHDGQNVFEDEGAFGGVALGLHDYLDENGPEIIVVAIDRHAEFDERVNEYCPWLHGAYSEKVLGERSPLGGKGEAYLEFIVHQLKPLIDDKYRTVPTQTSMAGCSLGALISTYAACRYPQIFTKVAAISSGFYRNQEEIEKLVATSDLSSVERFYLDGGTREAREKETINQLFVESSQALYDILKGKIAHTKFEIVEDAEHHYSYFKKRVPGMFSFLFS